MIDLALEHSLSRNLITPCLGFFGLFLMQNVLATSSVWSCHKLCLARSFEQPQQAE